MTSSNPTRDIPGGSARGIVIGAALREARLKAGLRCSDIAQQLGWSLSKVSRMETGVRGATDIHLVQFATLCRMPSTQLKRVLGLAAQGRTGDWVEKGDHARDTVRTLESRAGSLTSYSTTTVPVHAQTTDYTRARTDHDPEEALARRRAFTRHDDVNEAFFLIHETALRATVGDHRVMAEQLEHLALISQRSNRRVLVIPASTSGHHSCGPFTLLAGRELATPLVLAHHLTTTVVLDQPDDLATYRAAVSALTASALPEDRSRDVIKRMALHLARQPA